MPTTHGPDDRSGPAALLDRIQSTSIEVDRYLGTAARRRHRLTTTSIAAGTVAAVLTAVPALGGQALSARATEILSLGVPAWRVLCALAAACSVTATLATHLRRSRRYDENIFRAQRIRANLETIELGLTTGLITSREAGTRFLQTIEKTSFLDTRSTQNLPRLHG